MATEFLGHEDETWPDNDDDALVVVKLWQQPDGGVKGGIHQRGGVSDVQAMTGLLNLITSHMEHLGLTPTDLF